MVRNDSRLVFPHLTVLKASAGSGKTYALAHRFVQFMLSDTIPHNRLNNLLAITFSNNASREMKERILELLKKCCLDEEETARFFADALSLERPALRTKAERVLEEVLWNYSDFQVKTIDSFMTNVFKASALDFGYSPDFEILMSNDRLMKYAFDLFLRRVREGTPESRFITGIVEIIEQNRGGESGYLWEPTRQILVEIAEIYTKLAATGKPVTRTDYSLPLAELRRQIADAADELDRAIDESGLTRSRASSFDSLLSAVKAHRFSDLIGRGMKSLPVCKPSRQGERDVYDRIAHGWQRLGELIAAYTKIYACAYYTPYLLAYEGFRDLLERVKRQEGKIFIEDVNQMLARYMGQEVAPDIYFRLGDIIYHYLIDEFQDTSPVQWQNLLPLLENSLAQRGSLFVVGDTKQAIYGFRNADYTIMRTIEDANPFPSAHHRVEELYVNYRSTGAVTRFTERVFQEEVPRLDHYGAAARETGLLSYKQAVREGKQYQGYVEACLLDRDDDEPPEKEKLAGILDTLLSRGYRYSDVTVLTSRNEDVIRVTGWLNERKVPFVSYSSLDIRRRKVTGEILALLTFLDSPRDNLSFATFILGDIFRAFLAGRGKTAEAEKLHQFCFLHRRADRPLYKAFGEEMPVLWESCFDSLFRLSGYLPLYDLVVEVYRVFEVFELFGATEEGALARILEVIKDLEEKGGSNLRSFLDLALSTEDGETDWNMQIPSGIDAVKVMTIHKSKGLGFPVVVLLLYGEKNKGFRYIVQQEKDGVALLRLTKRMLPACEQFEKRYEEEERKERVNRLNTLYVALTRASAELYVVGVKGEKDYFPFACFPPGRFGEPSSIPSGAERRQTPIQGCHHTLPIRVASGTDQTLRFKEKERGELVHRVVSLIDYYDPRSNIDSGELCVKACREAGAEGASQELTGTIARFLEFLEASPIARYFERRAGRTVMTEQEFADADGRLFRMDRVVVDEDRVTVMEYKTGGDGNDEEKHVAQMTNYLRLVAQVFPGRSVEGIIAYVDLQKVRHLT